LAIAILAIAILAIAILAIAILAIAILAIAILAIAILAIAIDYHHAITNMIVQLRQHHSSQAARSHVPAKRAW